jgi:hypothetical protein
MMRYTKIVSVEAKPLDLVKFRNEYHADWLTKMLDDDLLAGYLCEEYRYFGGKIKDPDGFRCWYQATDHSQVVEGKPCACSFWEER